MQILKPRLIMDINPEQAIASAQDYLDSNLPGTEVENHADPFYGYYTPARDP